MGSSQRFAFLSAAWASRVFFRFVDILTHCMPLSWKGIDNVSFGCNPYYCSPTIPKDQLLWDFACGFGRWKIEANREEQSTVLPRVSSELMCHHLAEGPALELWYKENICCSPWCGSLNIFFSFNILSISGEWTSSKVQVFQQFNISPKLPGVFTGDLRIYRWFSS